MRSRTLSESAEINLLDIVWEVFMMWRPLVCLMVIMGILVSGVMYVREDKKIKEVAAQIEALKAEAPEVKEEKVEKVKEELTPLQISNVQYAAALAKRIIAREDYKNKSPYAALDGYNFKVLEMGVFVSGAMDSNMGKKITYIMKPVMEEALCQTLDISSDYIREMYSLDYSSSNRLEQDITDSSLDIRVYVPDSADEKALASAVKKAVESGLRKASSEGVSIYNSDIISDIKVSVNNDFVDNRNTGQIQILSDRISLEKYIADFTDDQKLLFKSLTGIKNRKDLEPSLEEVDGEEEVVEEPSSNDLEPELTMPDPIGIKDILKYFVLGAFLGAFILGGLLMVKEVLRPTIKDGYAIESVYGLRQLGEIREYPYTTSLGKFLHSQFVFNLRYRKSPEEYEKSIKDYINVCFGDSVPAILSLTGENGHLNAFGADIINIAGLDRSELLSTIKNHESAILAIPTGKIKNSQFDEIMALYKETQSTAEGVIIL